MTKKSRSRQVKDAQQKVRSTEEIKKEYLELMTHFGDAMVSFKAKESDVLNKVVQLNQEMRVSMALELEKAAVSKAVEQLKDVADSEQSVETLKESMTGDK